jgi:hypothetical protein
MVGNLKAGIVMISHRRNPYKNFVKICYFRSRNKGNKLHCDSYVPKKYFCYTGQSKPDKRQKFVAKKGIFILMVST